MPTLLSKCSPLAQDASCESATRVNCSYFSEYKKKPVIGGKKRSLELQNVFNAHSKADQNVFVFPPCHKVDKFTDACWPFCAPCLAKKCSPNFNAEYFAETQRFNKLAQIKMTLEPYREQSIGFRRIHSRDPLGANRFCAKWHEFGRVVRDDGDTSNTEYSICSKEKSVAFTTIQMHHDTTTTKSTLKKEIPPRRFFGHPMTTRSKFPFPPSHTFDSFTGNCWSSCHRCNPTKPPPSFNIRYFEKEAHFWKFADPIQLMEESYPDMSIHARRSLNALNKDRVMQFEK